MAEAQRPTLFSEECSEQLNLESSRARLMQQLTKPGKLLPRDFTAYFYSSVKNNDPAYVVTSHHTRDSLPRRRTVIPAYPYMQSLRWNPYVKTSSIEEEPDNAEEPKFKCKCASCITKKCPSLVSPTTTERQHHHKAFKDNIMTFCDQHTMTPRLNEVGCGSTPVASRQMSDVSVTASDIAVKDTQASMQIHQTYSPDKCPASIMKKNYGREYPPCCEHAHITTRFNNESEKDVLCDEYFQPSKTNSRKSFFQYRNEKECCNPRINIYNEGISDRVAAQVPITPRRVPHSPSNLKRNCSKGSVRSVCCDEGIPFSHRSDSRYHQNCKKSSSRSFYGEIEELRHISPVILRKNYDNKPVKYHKLPTVRMPKRVLTSNNDIESYIDRGNHQVLAPVSRRRKEKILD